MNFGIKTIGETVFCAECGRIISNTLSYNDNFCSVCGAPLKMEAVERYETEIEKEVQKELARINEENQN